MEIKKLDWDSDFFKIKVGEISNPESNSIVIQQEFDLIYLKSEKDSEIIIEGYLNSFFETKVIFSKQLIEEKQLSKNIFSIFKVPFSVNELYDLAFESGKMSRFNLDSKFGKDKFEELYKKWVDNSINKQFADEVLIYQQDNKTLGFVSYKINKGEATIGLIAVNPLSQGKGIGGKLIDAVEYQLIKEGVFKLMIPTQLENTDACNFYQKKGYNISHITVIKHFWRNN